MTPLFRMLLVLTGLLLLLNGGSQVLMAAPAFQVREREPSASLSTLARLAAMPAEIAAQRKVWVFFTDKDLFDSASCARALEQVAAGLDPHAADRRAKTMGPELVDFHDIPVAERYLAAMQTAGAEPIHSSRWLNAVSLRAPLAALEQISVMPFVQKITFVGGRGSDKLTPGSHRPTGGGRDPLDYGSSFDQLQEITVTDAHAAGFSGAGVIIAMLDSGYMHSHPAFASLLADGRLLAQWDFINNDNETQNEPGDPEGQDLHGTATWSIISGFCEGELIGAAYGASFLLAKTEDTSEEVPEEEDNWVAGAEWADQLGADVINSSILYYYWYTYEDMDGDTAVTTIAADIAVGRGIVVSVSAGNYGTQDWYYIAAPADGDSVIAVGATRPDGEMWDESSHGPTYDGRIKPEVVARGDNTVGAVRAGSIHGQPEAIYWPMSGTSMSAPLVTGAAALILEAHPDWTPMEVRDALMQTADNAHTPDNWRGWGRIDVMAAIGTLTAVPEEAQDEDQDTSGNSVVAHAPRLNTWPNPSPGDVQFSFHVPGTATTTATLEVYSPDGRRVQCFGELPADHPVHWDGRDTSGRKLPAGVYLVRLRAGDWHATNKVVLSR